MIDRNQICPNGRASTVTNVLARHCKWQTPFSDRDDALKRIVNKFRRPAIVQLNIEGLTASKMSILYYLAAQREALVILLQKTHCTPAQRLVLPNYQQTGFSLSRKHGLATFVYERLKWTLFDQSPLTLETQWLCVDVDRYKIVSVYKPSPIRLQVSDFPVFPHSCLYVGDFNCQHVEWGYDANSADEECLVGWANTNNLVLLHNPKNATSFHSDCWNTSTNPDLAFVSIDLDSLLPDTHVLEKFPRSQHRPSLITLPRFARPVPSTPVKRWNFRKAKWSHYITLTNKLARTLLPLNSPDMDQVYQCFCNAISTAAKK